MNEIKADNKEWVNPDGNQTFYLVYQGKDSSQTEFVHHIGNHPMLTTTGEVARLNRKGINTINHENIWIYPEIKEIQRDNRWGIFSRITQWRREMEVKPAADGTDPDLASPCCHIQEEGTVAHYSVDSELSSLGQETDKLAHYEKYKALTSFDTNRRHHPNNNVVLYGVSRGAATSFVALASRDNYDQVKLCIMEAPPATVSGIAKSVFGFLPSLGKYLYKTLGWLLFGFHHKTGREHQAIGHVDQFPNHVPLIVVSSKKDTLVNHKGSLNIALKVAAKRIDAINAATSVEEKENIAPVYFLQLDTPDHMDYAVGKDRERYQNFVHAVYRKHNLSHIVEYANKGEHELDVAELTRGVLNSQVIIQNTFKNNKKERNQIRTNAVEDFNNHVLNPLLPTDIAQKKETLKRAVSICTAMPLYSKNISTSFFGVSGKPCHPLKRFEDLMDESSKLLPASPGC